jgi:hypothetical protein
MVLTSYQDTHYLTLPVKGHKKCQFKHRHYLHNNSPLIVIFPWEPLCEMNEIQFHFKLPPKEFCFIYYHTTVTPRCLKALLHILNTTITCYLKEFVVHCW